VLANDPLTTDLLKRVGPGEIGVVLGTSNVPLANALAANGSQVIFVDHEFPEAQSLRVFLELRSIWEWFRSLDPSLPHDYIIVRGALERLSRRFVLGHLLPKIHRFVKPGGLLAIETATATPVPKPACGVPEIYGRETLLRLLSSDWDIEYAFTRQDVQGDNGDTRVCWPLSVLAKRKPLTQTHHMTP